jgi:hypothetical protein
VRRGGKGRKGREGTEAVAVREVTEETGCSACVYIGYRWVSVFICLELFPRLLMNADFFFDNVYLAALMPLCFQISLFATRPVLSSLSLYAFASRLC